MSFPVLLTLHLGPSDQALREFIRLEQPLPVAPLQRVICDNPRYADAVYAAWVTRKIAKGLPCGGGWHERYLSKPDGSIRIQPLTEYREK